MRTHVYNALCDRIEDLTANRQERNALFLIFSELLQGNELGVDYLVRQYRTYARDKMSRSTFNRLLILLREQDLIKVDKWGNRFERRANHYTLTEESHSLIRKSVTAYWTYSDYIHRRNTQRIGDPPRQASKWEPVKPYIEDWVQQLPIKAESTDFIAGLVELESRELIFQRLEATREQTVTEKRLRQLRNIPNTPFTARYRPLRSGRLQSVPGLYIGKELVRYIRPAADPYLNDGILFSLDYSKQELRILASMLDRSSPIHRWALDPTNGFEDLLQIYNINIPSNLLKAAMYSFVYGSEGYALGKDLDYNEALEMGYLSNYHAGRKIVKDLTEKAPELKELREHFSTVFTHNRVIKAPGGFTRYVDPEEDLTKQGSIKKNRARQIPLSHIIQGTGAYMARTIVAKARHLKHAQLHIPIHDGFVFYCTRASFGEAYQEAQELLTSVSRNIVPRVEIPHELEWIEGPK